MWLVNLLVNSHLEHIQKPVDVGGFPALSRKNFDTRGIIKTGEQSPVFLEVFAVIELNIILHKAQRCV